MRVSLTRDAIAQIREVAGSTSQRDLAALHGVSVREVARIQKGYPPAMTKRQYSRDFTPKTDRRVQLLIDRIPPTLYDAVKAKAKREGVSLRALVLGWLKEWIKD